MNCGDKMKKFAMLLLLIPMLLIAQQEDKSTYTKTGQAVPSFKVTTLDGKAFDIEQMKGKVILINFFATWCGPCMSEMPRVEKEIWEKYKGNNLIVLAIGREHSAEELVKFNKEKGFTFLIAPDPKREVYSKFAKESIPRNYIIDKNGKIALQEVGYSNEDFDKLKAELEKLLK
jgi:peroxiredoxin